MGHALMENRNGLVVDAWLTRPTAMPSGRGAAYGRAARRPPTRITLGADKAYDAEDFVNELRAMNVTPHVAQNTNGRSSAIDGRTTRHAGYASASASASGSRRRSAGSRRSPARSKPSSVAASGSDGPSPSRRPPTIWPACPSFWGRRMSAPAGCRSPAAGGSSRPTSGIATHSTSAGRRRSRSPTTAAKSPSARCRPASTSSTPCDSVGFHWDGMRGKGRDRGEGSAELLDDGSIEIEFAYNDGDEATLKAKRELLQQPASLTVS